MPKATSTFKAKATQPKGAAVWKIQAPTTFISYQSPSDLHNPQLRSRARAHVAGLQHANRLKAHTTIQQQENDEPARKESFFTADETENALVPVLPLHTSTQRAHSTGAAAFQIFGLNDPDNIAGSCLNRLQIDTNVVFARYQNVLAFVGPLIEAQKSLPFGSVQSTLYPMAFTHPTLTMTVIFATLLDVVYRSGQPTNSPDIYTVRGFVMQQINSTLDTSDQLISAVYLLGAYEAMWGFPEQSRLHSQGVARMIELRGGPERLGVLGPVIAWQEEINQNFIQRWRGTETVPRYFRQGVNR